MTRKEYQAKWQRKYYRRNRAAILLKRKQEYKAAYPDYQGYHLEHKYGITQVEYDELLRKQNGRCVLCGRLPNKKKRLAVDHDHATGRVRGLLCVGCNTLLGRIESIGFGWIAILCNYLLDSQASV